MNNSETSGNKISSNEISPCIHHLFEAQVAKSPEALAVLFENQQLTYRELNERANQLGHYLQSIGVGAEVMVGICAERSLDLIVGILGILKAGGAYVPIDPSYPKERIDFMLADTQLQFVVTEQQWIDFFTRNTSENILENTKVICLDRDWREIAQHNLGNSVSATTSQNLAYLIYTSGSTGKPKGVQMPHASVTHYLQAIAKILPIHNQDIYLHTASFSFTASVRQLFLPLSQGATSILATREQTRLPLDLFTLIEQQGITISDGVPSVWRYGLIALESLDRKYDHKYTEALSASKLRMIVFGGELLPYQLIQKLRRLFHLKRSSQNPIQFLNILGQTESIGHGFYAIPETDDREDGYVPVGHPLTDIQQVYILNEHLEPVQIGESGEVHIAGATLARGYLHRPAANAEKFISNPFNPQQKLFKTGDVARLNSDRNLEILGRIDFQVNIRGMRVELEEIEAVIKLYPLIHEAAVAAKDDGLGGQRLVAYIVVQDRDADLDVDLDVDLDTNLGELRNFLANKLPDYMVPHTLVIMEKLPVLPNGKLDRNRLPEPDISAIQREFVAPQTPTQKIMAKIWSEVLGIPQIGLHDNFLELGGHSLLASLVISRLREALSIELSIASLFAAPTIAILSKQIDQQISETSEQIPADSQNTSTDLVPVSRNQNLPLSPIQQRFWFLDQMEGANPAYNIVRAFKLQGNLNFTILEQAIATMINRHETLRTRFENIDGQPVQCIADKLPNKLRSTLPVIDLQAFAEDIQNTKAQHWIDQESQRPFALTESSLLRVVLLKLGTATHNLIIVMHHIIADAWSAANFLQELSIIYSALVKGLTSPLPDLVIQYADYAHWQRLLRQHQPTQIDDQIDYWKQQLADIPTAIKLPTERSRGAVQTFRGHLQQFQFDTQLTHRLKHLSQRSGSSLFMTLLAAFAVLLSRYSGQEDIVIGSPISNRNRVALEPLIGFFVNTLVLRTSLEGNPTFLELLQQVREMALAAYAHQDVSFDQLVEILQPQRSLSHSPLFQVMFVLQNSPLSKLELQDLQVTPLELVRGTAGATFDLTLSMQEIDQKLRGAFEYNANVFAPETIARMVESFQILVEAIADRPEEKIGYLPLLTASQRQQILVEWNRTQTDYPQKSIQQLFEEQVERNPDAIAIVYEQQQLTYRELNHRANQLAHYLQSLGVMQETLVGIYLERSPLVIIAMLGILKAGGAYLTLDSSYPSDRLGLILRNAQVPVLLTEQMTEQKLMGHHFSDLQEVCLDRDWTKICSEMTAKIGAESWQNLKCHTELNHLAHVIYTSGSTGQPKGVMICHRGVVRLVLNTNYISFQTTDIIAQSSNISFDAATLEIWGALLNGAKLVILKREIVLSPSELLHNLKIKGITILFLTTALFNQMVQEIPRAFSGLRYLLFGGEAVEPSRVKQLLETGMPQNLLNLYGPAENTSLSTWYPITKLVTETVPIGRAIANTQTYILDRHLQPVPVGVVGELYLGGAGLSVGYLHQPDLTSVQFIDHPFNNQVNNEKLYKTGDLVRYLPDGNIEFVGRIDFQVKIRGFRIELAEIETILGQHPQVRQALVMALEDASKGGKYIVAYIASKTERLTSRELRQFLKKSLPTYMIPAAFVILKALPLNSNGKVDRKNLPKPEPTSSEATLAPPRTWLEEQLVKIWCAVLHREQISIHDDFFELGGHSLLATSLISHIQEKLAIAIPLRSLFAAPTIAELSQVITARPMNAEKQNSTDEVAENLPPLVVQGRDKPIPLSFAQESIWHLQQLAPESCAYNSFFVLRFSGSLSNTVLESAFNEIIRRHEILRTSFVIVEGQPVQVISPSLTLPLTIIDLQNLPLSERTSEAQRLAALEYQQPFDLSSVPLIKTTLLRLAPQEHWLILNIHHIITDGWSLGLLLEELRVLYGAFTNGLPSPLPELPVQYADFTLWQRQHFHESVIQQQLTYWLHKLALNSPISSPTDVISNHPLDLPNKITNTLFYSIVLPVNLVTSIEALSRSLKVTTFVIILATLKILLFKYTHRNEILVMTTIGNRSSVNSEKMLGCFINDVILRSHISSEQTALTFLEQVQETLTEAINNKEIASQTVIDQAKNQTKGKHPLDILASITWLPPQNFSNWLLDVDFVSIERDLSLWDEEVPVEIYISSPSVNKPTIEIKALCSQELFTDETVELLFSDYPRMLEQIIQNPTSSLSS
ncbi:MAG: amino acid adenylation domain-containing protein [Pseudanabaena sp. ELA645]